MDRGEGEEGKWEMRDRVRRKRREEKRRREGGGRMEGAKQRKCRSG